MSVKLKNINNSKINLFIFSLPKKIFYTLVILILFCFSYVYRQELLELLHLDKKFKITNEEVNVLILDFNSLDDVSLEVDQILFDRLEELILREKLNVNLERLEYDGDMITVSERNDLLEIMHYHNASVVIYGNYFKEINDSLSTSFSYVIDNTLSKKFHLAEDDNSFFGKGFNLSSVSDVISGNMTRDIEYFVQYLSILIDVSSGNYDKAKQDCLWLILQGTYDKCIFRRH